MLCYDIPSFARQRQSVRAPDLLHHLRQSLLDIVVVQSGQQAASHAGGCCVSKGLL